MRAVNANESSPSLLDVSNVSTTGKESGILNKASSGKARSASFNFIQSSAQANGGHECRNTRVEGSGGHKFWTCARLRLRDLHSEARGRNWSECQTVKHRLIIKTCGKGALGCCQAGICRCE